MGWGYYTDIPAGPVALRTSPLYIYPNTVKVVKISGAQVREWLEMSAGPSTASTRPGAPEQNLINDAFPQLQLRHIDGVSYPST
jgi:2',3'-cyclic-nucleotide 2'-phosphodiesterase/3'-nucleotidase